MADSRLFDHIGYHVVYDESIQTALEYASKNGVSSIQLDLNLPKFFPETCNIWQKRSIREEAQSENVAITIHAPELDLQSFHPNVLEAVAARMTEVIAFAKDIGAGSITIHPGPVQGFSIAGETPTRITEVY